MIGPCFIMQYLVSDLVFQSSRGGRVSGMLCFKCLFFAVPLVGLQCVIVAFHGHTHLRFTPRKYVTSAKTNLVG